MILENHGTPGRAQNCSKADFQDSSGSKTGPDPALNAFKGRFAMNLLSVYFCFVKSSHSEDGDSLILPQLQSQLPSPWVYCFLPYLLCSQDGI
ncbi:hypothetical protein KIL84_004673, partial [Mauremys mutica]